MTAFDITTSTTRLTLALTCEGSQNALIDTGTLLATALKLPLHILVLEDADVFKLARFPFATAISGPGARRQSISVRSMEAAYESLEKRCWSDISARASAANISWSIERRRSELQQIISECSAGEIFLLRTDPQMRHLNQVYNRIEEIAPHLAGLVFLGQTAQLRSGPVLAIDDGAEAGKATIILASRIARMGQRQLNILALTKCKSECEKIKRRASSIVKSNTNIKFHHLGEGSGGSLEQIIRRVGPGILAGVLGAPPFNDADVTKELLAVAQCPLILMRFNQTRSASH